MDTEISSKPTIIQAQVTRLQTMCSDFLTANPSNGNAMSLANTIVPSVERNRAQAKKEIDGDGITSPTYQSLASEMAAGESAAWDMYNAENDSAAKIIARQFDYVHILMNQTGIEDPNPTEGHKCWPPGSVCH